MVLAQIKGGISNASTKLRQPAGPPVPLEREGPLRLWSLAAFGAFRGGCSAAGREVFVAFSNLRASLPSSCQWTTAHFLRTLLGLASLGDDGSLLTAVATFLPTAVCLLAASTSGGRVSPRIATVCWHVAEIALCVQPLRSEEALCMELMIACFRWAAALSIRQMAKRLRTAAEAAVRSVTRPLELR